MGYRQPSFGLAWWGANIFFLIGLLLFVGAWWLARKQDDMLNRAAHEPGRVVQLIETWNPEGKSLYAPLVEVNSKAFGTFRFKSHISSRPAGYQIGEVVSVIVDPDDKENTVIDTIVERWIAPLLLSVMGAIFAGAGLFSLALERWVRKKHRR